MSCIINSNRKIKYDPETYFTFVAEKASICLILGDLDLLKEDLKDFQEDDVNAIINACKTLAEHSKMKLGDPLQYALDVLTTGVAESGDEFSSQFRPMPKSQQNANFLVVESVPVAERRTDYLNAKSSFLTEDALKDPLGSYNKAISDFNSEIVKRCIYDEDSKKMRRAGEIMPSGRTFLNEALLQYKIELLNTLYEYLHGRANVFSSFNSDSELTNAIVRTLQDYRSKLSNLKEVDNLDAFEAFAILQNFDSLLKSEFAKTVKIKKDFENSDKVGMDMYTFLGGSVEYDSSFGDESADAKDYSSAIVKQMLAYFKRKHYVKDKGCVDTEKAIGFNSFTSLMSRIKEWIENGNEIAYKYLLYNTDPNTRSAQPATWTDVINAFIAEKSEYLTTDEIEALWGIRDSVMNCSGLLQKIFENQIRKTVRYRYLQVKPQYMNGRYEMVTTEMSESLVDTQNFNVQRCVQSAIYRIQNDPKLKTSLINKYDIRIDGDGGAEGYIVKLKNIRPDGKDVEIRFSAADKVHRYDIDATYYPESDTLDNVMTQVIKDFLGLPMPTAFKDAFGKYNNSSKDYYNAFIKLIGLTILAQDQDSTNDNWKDYLHFRKGIFDTRPYSNLFNMAANVMCELYSTTDTIVIRNSEGNALPNYQILSSAYTTKQQIFELEYDNNLRNGTHTKAHRDHRIFTENPLVKHRQLLGSIYVRGEITRNKQSKSSNQLTGKEAMYLDVVENFLKRINSGKSIILQSNCLSDKKTHFLVEYLINNVSFDGKQDSTRISHWLSTLVNPSAIISDREKAKGLFFENIIKSRGYRVKQQLLSIFSRYEKVYGAMLPAGWISVDDIGKNAGQELEEIKSNLNLLRTFLNGKSESQLNKDFGSDADLNENLDYYAYDQKHCDVNYMLLHEAEMYLFDVPVFKESEFNKEVFNKSAFGKYWNFQVRNFAKGLDKTGFKFDHYYDTSLSSLSQLTLKIDDKWSDYNRKYIKSFILNDSDENATIDTAEEVELHPVLEAYMLANAYFSQSFNEVAFGATNGFANKYKGQSLKSLEEMYRNGAISEDEFERSRFNIFVKFQGAKLVDETKRTVHAGAVKTPYAQGMKYGVSRVWKIAVVNDKFRSSFNHTGDLGYLQVCDGSGYASPYVSRQINESLLDAYVGKNKKTIGVQIDPETGVLQQIKWAEFTDTNQQRINDRHVEKRFKKMHSFQLDSRVTDDIKLNIARFYGENAQYDEESEHRLLTHTGKIYFKDWTTGKYYRIERFSTVNKGDALELKRIVVECDASGKVVNEKEIPQSVDINTIYDLDALFGGAYCMERNDDLGTLESSEANYDIVGNMIGYYDIKDKMIAYVVNKSAFKVGAMNVNSDTVFDSTNEEPLKYFDMTSSYFGVQMNADHELNEAEVSEMTQMMQALMQSAAKKGVVDEVYKLIGQIALENIKQYRDLLDNNGNAVSEDKMYLTIGKLFTENFVSGNKDSLGLAEAFIINAARTLKQNNVDIKIPFSSNQVKGIFESTITSTFNKLGIRRKYAGFGGVQCPSYNIMPVYKSLDGTDYTDFQDLADELRKDLETKRAQEEIHGKSYPWNINNVFDKISIGDSWNPYVVPIEPSELEIEDTIVVQNTLTNETHTIKIDSIADLDIYQNLLVSDHYKLYRWTIQSRELRQSLDTVKYGEESGYLHQLDYERAAVYLRNWKTFREKINPEDPDTTSCVFDKSDRELLLTFALQKRNECIANALKDSGIKWPVDATEENLLERIEIDENATDFLAHLKQIKWNEMKPEDKLKKIQDLAILYCEDKLQKILETLDSTGFYELDPQTGLGDKPIRMHEYHKKPTQIIIGKAFAKEFNLQKNDKIKDIRTKGVTFFQDRLKLKYSRPDINGYDGVLYKPNGDKVYVMLNPGNNLTDRTSGLTLNTRYKVVNGFWTLDGEPLFEAYDVDIRMDANGADVFIIKGKNGYKNVTTSQEYIYFYPQYTEENANTFKRFDKESIKTLAYGIDAANGSVSDAYWAWIKNQAERQYNAFELQLNYILTRIPSQSMQSFTDAEVVMWADTDMNEIYCARSVTWIQGSDYDIDKGYMLQYMVTDDGVVLTMSDLENETFEEEKILVDRNGNNTPVTTKSLFGPYYVLQLIAPAGRNFTRDDKNGTIKVPWEVIMWIIKRGRIDYLNEILSQVGDQKDISLSFQEYELIKDPFFTKEEYEDGIKRVMDLLRIHEKSKPRQGWKLKAALQNTCVAGIHVVLKSPASQIYMTKPITMDTLKGIGKKSSLSKDEETISLDNPWSIFMMQEQNMTGRDVIGIGAVSLKHYFAASTFMHKQISKMEDIVKNGDLLSQDDQNKLVGLFFDLVFDSKKDNSIATLANLNFEKLQVLLGICKKKGFDGIITYNNGGQTIEEVFKGKGNENIFKLGKEYIDGNKMNFSKLIQLLNVKSNGYWWAPVTAISSYSELISAATDNAKELILSKINATTKFADIYTYLLSTGMTLEEISSILMSDVLKIATKYTQDNIYDPTIKWSSLENAVNFLLDRQPLDGVKQSQFDAFLTNADLIESLCKNQDFLDLFAGIDQRWYDELQHPTDENAVVVNTLTLPNTDDSVKNTIRAIVKFKRKNLDAADRDGVGTDEQAIRRASVANQFAEEILEKTKEYLKTNSDAFLVFLRSKINIYQGRSFDSEYVEYGAYQEDTFYDESLVGSDVDDGGYGYDSYEDDSYNIDYKLDRSSAMRLYKYLSDYVIPKNKALAILKAKAEESGKPNPIKVLENLADNILPGVEEQRIHGQILGINQGLKTNDYEEFKWIYNIEKFINGRYFANNMPTDFSMIRFIMDEAYRAEQIDNYEKCKTSVNILKCITNVNHFWAMIQIAGINRSFIERAAAIRIERDVANKLLALTGSKDPKFKSISVSEFKELQRVVSDTLLYNWLTTLPLSIPIVSTKGNANLLTDSPSSILAQSSTGPKNRIAYYSIEERGLHEWLSDFKHLMEAYVIPRLIQSQGLGKDKIGKEFVLNLISDIRQDPMTNEIYTYYKPTIDLANASESPKLDGLYALIARDFNALAVKKADSLLGTDCGWTFGDLFYLYNLLISRDSIGGRSFTKLFEQFTTSNDRNSLVYKYNQFLANLDNGPLRWTSSEYDNTGDITYRSKDESNPTIVINLNDVRYRCGIISPNGKFGIKKVNNEVFLDGTRLEPMKDKHIINLPFISKQIGQTDASPREVPNRQIASTNDRELVMAIIINLQEMLGNKAEIITYEKASDLEKYGIRNIEEDANGFMKDGKIFINMNKLDIKTPVHEYMHLICAMLKYGTPAQRNLYYKLLRERPSHSNANLSYGVSSAEWKAIEQHVKNNYGNILAASDLQEEILVHALAKAFEKAFWNNNLESKTITEASVLEDVRLAMQSIFKVNLSNLQELKTDDGEVVYGVSLEGDLGNMSMGQFLQIFNSQFYGHYSDRIGTFVIPINQRLAKLKKKLVDKGDIEIDPSTEKYC
jgi:hypothetical protein